MERGTQFILTALLLASTAVASATSFAQERRERTIDEIKV